MNAANQAIAQGAVHDHTSLPPDGPAWAPALSEAELAELVGGSALPALTGRLVPLTPPAQWPGFVTP